MWMLREMLGCHWVYFGGFYYFKKKKKKKTACTALSLLTHRNHDVVLDVVRVFFCFLCFLSIKTVFIWIISCGNKRKDNWKGRDNQKTSNISHQQCETDVKTMLISHFPMWNFFDLMWLKKNSLTSKPHHHHPASFSFSFEIYCCWRDTAKKTKSVVVCCWRTTNVRASDTCWWVILCLNCCTCSIVGNNLRSLFSLGIFIFF